MDKSFYLSCFFRIELCILFASGYALEVSISLIADESKILTDSTLMIIGSVSRELYTVLSTSLLRNREIVKRSGVVS